MNTLERSLLASKLAASLKGCSADSQIHERNVTVILAHLTGVILEDHHYGLIDLALEIQRMPQADEYKSQSLINELLHWLEPCCCPAVLFAKIRELPDPALLTRERLHQMARDSMNFASNPMQVSLHRAKLIERAYGDHNKTCELEKLPPQEAMAVLAIFGIQRSSFSWPQKDRLMSHLF